jgi:glycosyltransferase involved in cell wall biosynthesis
VALSVLQALGGGSIGGTETSVFALAPRLAAEGVRVEVSLLDGHGPVSESRRGGPLPIHDLAAGGGGLAGAALRFRRLLASGRYDLVHLYGIRMATIGRLAARTLAARPVVVHGIRGLHVTEGEHASDARTRAIMAVERQLARWTDAYLANSQGAVAFMTAHGLPAGKFEVIPNGIDLDLWPAPAPRPPRARPVAVCVANFRPRKRQEDLIDAVALLAAEGVALECRFAGAGSTLDAMRERASARGIADRVTFLGSVPPGRLGPVLADADIAVLPSAWEGMSVGMLEAMAAGLPVVATDVPGTREIVVEGVTGRLVPVRRPDLLAAGLSALARDDALRRRYGDAGRRRIEAHFTLTLNVRRHLDAYRRLVEARRLPEHTR